MRAFFMTTALVFCLVLAQAQAAPAQGFVVGNPNFGWGNAWAYQQQQSFWGVPGYGWGPVGGVWVGEPGWGYGPPIFVAPPRITPGPRYGPYNGMFLNNYGLMSGRNPRWVTVPPRSGPWYPTVPAYRR